jgi:hypothetical protein
MTHFTLGHGGRHRGPHLHLHLLPVVVAAIVTAALVLLLAPAAHAVTSARGTITASSAANTYVLEVENTGTDAIQCMRFFAASGVVLTGVSSPASLEGTTRFAAQTQISPGASKLFTFTTQAAYPVNGGGHLDVSATCSLGSDVGSDVTGPAPPPLVLPCACTRLVADFGSLKTNSANKRRLDLNIEWTMFCRIGTGGCSGQIDVTTPGLADATVAPPAGGIIRCSSNPCKAQKALRTKVRIILPARYAGTLRANRMLIVKVQPYCLTPAGKRVKQKALTMHLVFDRHGRFDRQGSAVHGPRRDNGSNKPFPQQMV